MTAAQDTFEAVTGLEQELERNLVGYRYLADRYGHDTAVVQMLPLLADRPHEVVAGALAVALMRLSGGS